MYVLGAGGFAREVALVLSEQGVVILGYLSDDESVHGQDLPYGKVLGSIGDIAINNIGYVFIPGVGSPQLRKSLVRRALNQGWTARGAISPKACLPTSLRAAHVEIGTGSIICSGVSATVNIKVGQYVNVNLNCTLGHDCVLEDYVNLSPDVNVSGYVHIEEGVDVGTGAVILPHVRIGKGSVIGAGATVTKDVPPGELWVGTPAKFLRKVE